MRTLVLAAVLLAAAPTAQADDKSAVELKAKVAFKFASLAAKTKTVSVAPAPRPAEKKDAKPEEKKVERAEKPASTIVGYTYKQVCVNGVCQIVAVPVYGN